MILFKKHLKYHYLSYLFNNILILNFLAMKKLIGLVFLIVIFVTTAAITSSKPNTMHSLEGTWELQNFYNYDGENITGTVPLTEGYRQVKMY